MARTRGKARNATKRMIRIPRLGKDGPYKPPPGGGSSRRAGLLCKTAGLAPHRLGRAGERLTEQLGLELGDAAECAAAIVALQRCLVTLVLRQAVIGATAQAAMNLDGYVHARSRLFRRANEARPVSILNAARIATSVFPKPTSPQINRSIGRSDSMSVLEAWIARN